ncbi:Uncharacterised protein [Segatella copri]|nr:Uncharacterised protein [Segatella copri]
MLVRLQILPYFRDETSYQSCLFCYVTILIISFSPPLKSFIDLLPRFILQHLCKVCLAFYKIVDWLIRQIFWCEIGLAKHRGTHHHPLLF